MVEITIGLPKGSLNNVNRGNTYQLFVDAGYEVRGYEPGKESYEINILNDDEIKAFLTRPQSTPVELNRGMVDIAIVGEDWVMEESVLSDNDIEKIGDLNYGETRLIVAVPKESPYNDLSQVFRENKDRETPILCFTEYPNLTRKYIMENEAYQEIWGDAVPYVQVRGLRDGDNKKVQVINSDGATEVYIAKGADLIVSCTGEKMEKAKMIYEQLLGAVTARKYFDVKFNIANDSVEEVSKFLVDNKFCSAEPTVNEGSSFSQINVLIPKNHFPEMLDGIKALGASSIIRSDVKQYVI